MKTAKLRSSHSSDSYVLLMVLILGAISAVILGSAVTRTIHTATLNERNTHYTVNLSAAEAATEKAIARMIVDYQNGGEDRVERHVDLGYYEVVPKPDENPYWEQFEFSNGQGDQNQTYVQRISSRSYVRLESQFCGLYGLASTYRVLSNARQKTGRFTSVVGAVQQDIQLASIPVFQFAFFCNGLMEFTVAKDLIVNGRIHANGDIFLGSAGPVTFNAPVTATGTIQRKDWGGTSFGGPGANTFNGVPDYRTNVAQLFLPIGDRNTTTNLHQIIEIPPTGEIKDSPLGRERFYNKAGLVIVAYDNRVEVLIRSSFSDTSPTPLVWTTNIPGFLSTNVAFFDYREGASMKTVEINMEGLKNWIKDDPDVRAKHLPGNPVNILYVADCRSVASTDKNAIRLTDGDTLPGEGKGFTVATCNPLYILGNYNIPSSTPVPAALVSDALTILSYNWDDSKTDLLPSAQSTTINAAILTGIVSSKGASGNSPFSGGVLNLVRLLENWNGCTFALNTSVVNLFESTQATAPFKPPDGAGYYKPPTRQFNFDSSLTNANRLPPGTPMLSALIRAKWASPPPNTTTYAGE